MTDMGEAIGRAFSRTIAAIAIIAFCFGALMFWGMPKLWAIIKPWLHQMTT